MKVTWISHGIQSLFNPHAWRHMMGNERHGCELETSKVAKLIQSCNRCIIRLACAT